VVDVTQWVGGPRTSSDSFYACSVIPEYEYESLWIRRSGTADRGALDRFLAPLAAGLKRQAGFGRHFGANDDT
jgi:hypothetical protein